MKQREWEKKKRTNAKRTLFHVWRRRLQSRSGVKQTRLSICFPRREIRAGGKEKNSAEETVSETAGDKTADERRSLLNFRSLSACHSAVPLNVAAGGLGTGCRILLLPGAERAPSARQNERRAPNWIRRNESTASKKPAPPDEDLGLAPEAARLDTRIQSRQTASIRRNLLCFPSFLLSNLHDRTRRKSGRSSAYAVRSPPPWSYCMRQFFYFFFPAL